MAPLAAEVVVLKRSHMSQQQFSIPLSNVNTIVRAERNVLATAYIAGLVVTEKGTIHAM